MRHTNVPFLSRQVGGQQHFCRSSFFVLVGPCQITIKDLRRVSRDLGENLGERELEAMITAFDKNLDGSVSLDEFVVSMVKIGSIDPFSAS